MREYIYGAIIQEDLIMEKTIYDERNGLWYDLRGGGGGSGRALYDGGGSFFDREHRHNHRGMVY